MEWLAKLCGHFALLYALSGIAASSAFAQFAHPYASAAYQRNHEKLGRAFGQLFSGVTLRTSLTRLSSTAQVPVWLDRRVDGEQIVQLTGADTTVRRTLDALTEQLGLAWVWIGEVPYVCQASDAPQLHATYWRHAIAANGTLIDRPSGDLQWTLPAEPRTLLVNFLSNIDIDVPIGDAPQHDLWNPASLQDIEAATAATLLLGGFQLQLSPRSSAWVIEDAPAATADRTTRFAWPYPADAVEKIDAARREAIEDRHARGFEWRTVGKRAWLNASVEMHREVQSAILKLTDASDSSSKSSSAAAAGTRPAATAAQLRELERRRYTLQLRGRLVDILPAIASHLGLQIAGEIERDLQDRLIDVTANDATADVLLEKIAASAKCSIVRDGLRIRVAAGSESAATTSSPPSP